MADNRAEQLTAQFYEWEQSGRGWQVYDIPVDLEPPFVPFFYHGVQPTRYVDDGKKPTVFNRLTNIFAVATAEEDTQAPDETPLEPYPFTDDAPLSVVRVSLPKGHIVKVTEVEQLLLMLSYCNAPVSFEIIAKHLSIVIQLVCREHDLLHVQSHLKAYFPESVVRIATDELFDIIPENDEAFGYDFGLQEEFMRPIAMSERFDSDPYIGLFAVLENLQEGEQALLQALFKGAVNPWAENIIRAVSDNKGDAFFVDAPDMLPLSKEKIRYPLFGVTIRAIGCGTTSDEAKAVANRVRNSLIHFSASTSNKLIPLSNENYGSGNFYEDIMLRQSRRLGMLLNSRELATLVHLPSASVVSQKLERDTKKTKAAPSITEGHDFVLGTNMHQGKEKEVTLTPSQRLKHTHIIGATGTGKSTLLLNLIAQDLHLGNGAAILDPHGDLIESIIPWIPEERMQDVIIINPADAEFPVGFNILTAHSEIEKDILSSDLVAVFRRLSTSWGDQMNSVFANAILAFLESTQGGTLLDLRRFLVEKPFRDTFLKTVRDPNSIYYWTKEFPLIKSNSIGPILTRLDTFLRPKIIRNMVAQKKSLDFEDILNSKKILLVKLSQGLIGNENSYLLGTFIVSKIQQAAMARQAQSKEERDDFFLYIDEFQNFITPSMASILSGARKYHLGLILAHQDMQQLQKQDGELASSVLSNAGTRICFRVGDADAKKFEDGFAFFDAKDLQNLETGEAIVRIDRADFDFNIEIGSLPELKQETIEILTDYVVSLSREKHGTPKIQVEETIAQVQDEPIPAQEVEQKIKTPAAQPTEQVKEALQERATTPKEEASLTEEKIQETTASLSEKKTQSDHRYLQSLIKRMAESRGYIANIEELTPDGKGRVDVSLEKNRKRIACEVSVTTGDVWEVHNIEKCLVAGYDTIIVCSNDKRNLDNIQKLLQEKFDKIIQERVLTFLPDELFHYLDVQIAKEASTETRMKGYRVKVEYNPVSQEEAQLKKENIIKTVAKSMRKKKEN